MVDGLGSGNPVSDLTSDINYPNNPNGRALITSLEAPTDWANNYGTRIRGYLYPPADGNYTFWIASDDYSQLWLGTDDDPATLFRLRTYRAGQLHASGPNTLPDVIAKAAAGRE